MGQFVRRHRKLGAKISARKPVAEKRVGFLHHLLNFSHRVETNLLVESLRSKPAYCELESEDSPVEQNHLSAPAGRSDLLGLLVAVLFLVGSGLSLMIWDVRYEREVSSIAISPTP